MAHILAKDDQTERRNEAPKPRQALCYNSEEPRIPCLKRSPNTCGSNPKMLGLKLRVRPKSRLVCGLGFRG